MKALVYHVSPWRWIVCKAASFVLRKACLGPLSGLRLVEATVPELPGERWVRVRTILGGVCGTDLALIMLRNHPATILQRFASFPAILGHENVGVIDRIGQAVGGWKAGDRVCVEPALGCVARGGQALCPQCAAGRTTLCERHGDDGLPPRALIGLNHITGGSWAEYFLAHESQLHRVPDSLPDEAAVLVDPIASAAHAVLRRAPRDNETILIHGSGIIGLGIVASLRALGAANPISMIARHSFQSELGRRLGVTDIIGLSRGTRSAERYDEIARRTGGRRIPGRFGNQGLMGGYDLVYDCTGTGPGMTDSLKWTRPRGSMVCVGTSGIALLDTTPIWFDEIEVIGTNGRQIETQGGRAIHTYDLVLEWATNGRLDLSAIPVHRFPLADYRRAFDMLQRRDQHPIIKAAFDPRA